LKSSWYGSATPAFGIAGEHLPVLERLDDGDG
jgi:hypothetical protein